MPSLPGFGQSARPDWIISIRDLAAWVTWFTRELKLPKPLNVMGISMGGWIAAEIATVNAAIFKKMVLVGEAGLKPEYAQYYDKVWTPEEEQVEINREMAARLLWKPYMRSHTLASLLRGIATPTLMVWGHEDQIIPLDVCQLSQRAIKGATAEILDRCGHMPEMEQPDVFVKAVLDVLL